MKKRLGLFHLGVMTVAALAQGCQGNGDEIENDVLEAITPTTGAGGEAISTGAPSPKGGAATGSECGEQVGALVFQQAIAQAAALSSGQSAGFYLCPGREAYYRVNVPAGRIVRIGMHSKLADGDLDLVAYDSKGKLLGARNGDEYPYTFREQETDEEYLGFYAAKAPATYYVRVVGHEGAGGAYSLHVDTYRYEDGASCTGAGFSFDDCIGTGQNGEGLLPFPFPDPKDALGEGYDFASFGNYRFARRELVMLVRNALTETRRAFPGTTKLSFQDICQRDGVTPGYDVDSPRHPQSTHDQGGNIDISYFQTDGSNDAEIVCGDGAKHEDGYCTSKATMTNFVDFPRQAFFMAKLFASARTRVVGVDVVLAPLIQSAAESLSRLPKGDPKRISAAELQGFSTRMASGDGWPYHHHHIHLSMNWWGSSDARQGFSLPTMGAPGVRLDSLETTFPPRP